MTDEATIFVVPPGGMVYHDGESFTVTEDASVRRGCSIFLTQTQYMALRTQESWSGLPPLHSEQELEPLKKSGGPGG